MDGVSFLSGFRYIDAASFPLVLRCMDGVPISFPPMLRCVDGATFPSVLRCVDGSTFPSVLRCVDDVHTTFSLVLWCMAAVVLVVCTSGDL